MSEVTQCVHSVEPSADRARIALSGSDWMVCCAPMGMQREVVERQIGLTWKILPCEDNPHECPTDAGRLHWYMSQKVVLS